MRIEIPSDQQPLVYLQTQIGSSGLNGVVRLLSQTLFVNDSTVTPKEREAVRYYLAYREDCNACVNFRAGRDIPEYSDEEMSDEWYDNIPNYKTWPGYTARERLAIEFVSRIFDDHLDVEQDDDLWTRLHGAFDLVEIEDLVLISAFVSASNMIREVFLGPVPVCTVPSADSGIDQIVPAAQSS